MQTKSKKPTVYPAVLCGVNFFLIVTIKAPCRNSKRPRNAIFLPFWFYFKKCRAFLYYWIGTDSAPAFDIGEIGVLRYWKFDCKATIERNYKAA